MNETVSLGSQPQKRPQALSAQTAPRMMPTLKIGNAITAVRYARRSRVSAFGSGRARPAAQPFSSPCGCHTRIRCRTEATPETRKTPEPSDTIDTWIGNQNDCSAGTTGAASEYRWVPPKYSRSSTGTSTNGHATWKAGLRRKTRAATTPSAHVTEMNSYMLPHGKRPIANARTTSDPTWKTKARHTKSCVIRAHPAPRVEEVSSSPVSVIDDDSVSPSPSVATSSRVAVFCTRNPA